MGKDELDNETKEQIGVVFDGSNYPEILSPKKINQIMKNIYGSWDEQAYFRLLKQFSLPLDKQIKQFSKGMKMKLAISVALSHHSKLLILDEAGSAWELDMVDKALLQKAVLERPAEQECVLTAHAAPQWMLDAADYATEMKCHRHPYQRGISARKGIEY